MVGSWVQLPRSIRDLFQRARWEWWAVTNTISDVNSANRSEKVKCKSVDYLFCVRFVRIISFVLAVSCSVETTWRSGGQEHEVVSQHTGQALDLLDRPGPGAEERAESPFVPGDRTLHLPPLVVSGPRQAPLRRPPVSGLGPLPTGVPGLQREDRVRDVELVPAQDLVVFGIVRSVD